MGLVLRTDEPTITRSVQEPGAWGAWKIPVQSYGEKYCNVNSFPVTDGRWSADLGEDRRRIREAHQGGEDGAGGVAMRHSPAHCSICSTGMISVNRESTVVLA